MPHVLIIGAGPAGTTAAILLARGGWSVTLIEQHRFPRDKVCGECLSALGTDVLNRLGLFERLLEAGAVELRAAKLYAARGAGASFALPRPMWGISRSVMDSLLLDAARDHGANVLQPARCESISQDSKPRVLVRDLLNNAIQEFALDHLIVADGRGSHRRLGATGDFGIKAHFENINGPRDSIELFATRGRYGGLAAIEDDQWNAAFSVSARQLRRHHGNVDALFAELVRGNQMLARRLKGARQIGPWLSAPLPRFGVKMNGAGAIPVGNAAAALEPIGGEGMGLAMRSAELAAEALLRSDSTSLPIRESLGKLYKKLWRTRRFASRAGAILFCAPGAADAGFRIMQSAPWLQRLAVRLVGK